MLGEERARVTIMGLGLFGGGVGAALFWSELGSTVTVTDLRSAEELAPSIKQLEKTSCRFVLGEHRDEDFINADLIVVNPAVKPDNGYLALAREHGANLTTEVGTVLRLVHGPVFGVTGSNGKSTTTALLGKILTHANHKTLIGGNLGGSLLPEMKNYWPSAPVVLELSSFQLFYLDRDKLSPNYAIITNLSPNHLDWHQTVTDYYTAKQNILRHQHPDDTAILNAEDPVLREWSEECCARVGLYGWNDPDIPNAAFVSGNDIILRLAGHEKAALSLDSLKLPGRHNVENLLAAALAAYMYLHDTKSIKHGLEEFTGLPHRLELVGESKGVRYYNDSIATTPESAIAALNSFDCPKVIILGGYDKGISFVELGRAVDEKACAAVVLGQTAEGIAKTVHKAEVYPAQTLADAVARAGELCPKGGAVLLSPACASYDMFTNFEERGKCFCEIVKKLAE
ncbi:MAG: UDP-N-acetylmuramoyl-L-alanine--D-glutamate ligase [Planctomycetes bacterium]|nr:UDP-N-acetylmuramoyl-L-alanine--D-glutamate ligase [Planctomycetota bacterium]